MSKEFVPYQPSLDMKEIGFDEPCVYYVDKNNESYIYNFETHPDEFIEWCGVNVIPTPTFSQAFRWILKNHKLHSFVDIYPTTDEPDRCWFMIRYLERGEDGKEDYMSGWFTNQDNINNSRLNKLLEIIESKSE